MLVKEKWTYNGPSKEIKYEVNENECWNCTSHSAYGDGYPKLIRNGKKYRMSRYIYEMMKGDIPEGMVIMHKCDNPRCINPDHLVAGTQSDNMKDMFEKGRNHVGPGRVLTDEDIQDILNDKRSHAELARLYEVHYNTIWNIRNGRTWKGVVAK